MYLPYLLEIAKSFYSDFDLLHHLDRLEQAHHQIAIRIFIIEIPLTLRMPRSFLISAAFFIVSMSLRLSYADLSLPVLLLTPADLGEVGALKVALTSCIQLTDILGKKSGFSSHLLGKSGLNSSYYLPPFAHLKITLCFK